MANKDLVQRDLKVVWHPFTQMKTARPPIPIVKGKGALVFDEDGKAYIDAIASWWLNTHGHGHPYIAEKIYQQALAIEHIIFADFTHHPAVELVERLLEKINGNQARAFFSDNGSTSIEVALKMCFQHWHNLDQPKTKIIAFENAYHGDTFGAMSVGARSAFSAPFAPFLFDVEFIEPPLPGNEQLAIDQMKKALESDDVAGFIYEPLIQGAGGMLMHDPKVLDTLIGLCKAKNVLCIADEVMVGFGRTGKFFGSHWMENQADIMCFSKGLTGGAMALAITTCTDQVFQAFYSSDKWKTLFHGHSFTGNPIACAAALASMDLFDRPETATSLLRIEKQHLEFKEKIKDHPLVTNLRHQGVILAFELQNEGDNSYFSSIRDEIWHFFIDRQIILRPLGNTIYINPPYCITETELNQVYQVIEDLLKHLQLR